MNNSEGQIRAPSVDMDVLRRGRLDQLRGVETKGLDTLDSRRPAVPVTTFDSGLDVIGVACRFAETVVDFIEEAGRAPDARVGVERTVPSGHRALDDAGLNIVDAELTVELARSRKSPIELSLVTSIATICSMDLPMAT